MVSITPIRVPLVLKGTNCSDYQHLLPHRLRFPYLYYCTLFQCLPKDMARQVFSEGVSETKVMAIPDLTFLAKHFNFDDSTLRERKEEL